MNRNKKPFPSGMRVAALYLLMGVLLLLAVTLFSGRESMRATEEYFDRTINFVKVQSTSYEKYNDTVTAKALRRMAVSVRQLAENDTLDLYDPEALRKETESLWLTGIAVLDENGESLCEYTDGNIDYAQFAESLREQAAMNVLQNPQKTYLKRILLQDGTAVDVATRRAAAGDAVLLAYRVTPPEFVEGTALSIQSVLDGYPKNISGTIFIVQDNKVIAANDPSLIGLYTTNSPLVQGIRKAGAPDILTHTRDWANSGCYFGMYSNGQNFDLYLYIVYRRKIGVPQFQQRTADGTDLLSDLCGSAANAAPPLHEACGAAKKGAGAEVSRPAGRAEPQAGACRPARGSGKPRQAGVLVQHEPRHPHSDERHYRLHLAGGDPC